MSNDAWILAAGIFIGALGSWPLALALIYEPRKRRTRNVYQDWHVENKRLAADEWRVLEPKG